MRRGLLSVMAVIMIVVVELVGKLNCMTAIIQNWGSIAVINMDKRREEDDIYVQEMPQNCSMLNRR
jgi:hypothetical protein